MAPKCMGKRHLGYGQIAGGSAAPAPAAGGFRGGGASARAAGRGGIALRAPVFERRIRVRLWTGSQASRTQAAHKD
jgi:hypothetical protein